MNESAPNSAIQAELLGLVESLSGYDSDELDCESSFLELGFDSLFLTQLSTALRREFGVEITFRQLFAELPSIATLAAHIEPLLPPERRPRTAPEPAAAAAEAKPAPETTDFASAPVTGATGPSAPVGPALRELIEAQLKLMRRQLELVSGRSAEALPPATAASAPSPREAPVDEVPAPAEDAPELPEGFVPRAAGADGEDELGVAERAHLEALVAAYVAKTPGSKSSTQTHRHWHADPRTAAGFNRLWKEMVYPLVVTRSKGSRLWDIDGNEYIDLLNGFGPNFLGHSPDFITEALVEQLRDGVEIGPQTPLAGETAKLICEFSGMDRATFVNTGSEAVQAAIRVARTVTGRDLIVVFSGDYHGNFDEVLVRAANRPGRLRTVPLAPGIPFDSVSNVVVLDYGSDEALTTVAELGPKLAAVLVEPIQSRRPELQPRDFLHRLREITRQHDVVLVFDEVITGFRSQPGGAQAFYGVQADLATYGKVLGGGMPIGVVAGRRRFMDTFDGGHWQYGDDSFPAAGVTFFAGTFIRHPLTIRATHATLSYLKREAGAIHQRINDKTERLCNALNALFQRHDIAIEVPHANSQIFVRVKETHPLAMLLYFHLRLRGVYIQEGFPCYLTDAHTDSDIEAICAAFESAVAEMIEAGIFGAAPEAGRTGLAPAGEPFALTDSQFEICFESQLNPAASCAYNESDTLILRGPVDTDALRQALEDAVDRHDALRLRFSEDRQFFGERAELELGRVDLRATPAAEREAAVRAVIDELVARPFDLEHGPVCAARLLVLEDRLHYLCFCAHHAAYDGWSADLLLSELAERYSARLEDRPPRLADAPSFREFAVQTARLGGGDAGAASRAHWRERFAEPPPALRLPIDGRRPGQWDYRGDTVSRRFAASLSEQLTGLARTSGATLFAVTLAAYKLLLWRLSGQRQFAVGVSLASQPILEMSDVVGHGVNFIPVPVSIDPAASAARLIRDTMADVVELSEYPHCSIGTLVRGLGLARDPSRPLLAQVIFNYAPAKSGLSFSGLESEFTENPRRHVHSELFANLMDTGQGLQADWDFATTLVDRETVIQWLACFETILEQMAANPEQPLTDLDWTPAATRTQIAELSAGPELEPPAARVERWFERLVHDGPDRPAASDSERRWSYRDLDAHANAVEAALADRASEPDAIVGIMGRRRVEMLAAILGAFKADRCYLFLDPKLPDARIRFMVDDSGCDVILCDAESLERGRATGVEVIELEGLEPVPPRPRTVRPSATAPAYLIYTSGSTGQPKGVVVGHPEVVNFLAAMHRRPGLERDDALLALTTLSFDISILELLGPLTLGARVHIASDASLADPRALLEELQRVRPTVVQATPALWRLLIDQGWGGDRKLKIFCGGEALPEDLAATMAGQCRELWNLYGPTETTVWSTCFRVSEDSPVRIGTPIHNTRLRVVDPAGGAVPIGVPGELLIGGAGVARGYLRRPQLTASAFVELDGERWYRTGDQVRWRNDGNLECLGRLDHQVKIRGYRVELGEIENALQENEHIRECTAKVFPVDGEQWLVAYLVTDGAEPPNTVALRKHLRARLPDPMIPQQFQFLERLPRLNNGKIDRNALPRPQATLAVARVPSLESDVERRIAAIWSELTSAENIGREDNFFDLGGHSLLALKAVAQMQQAFGNRIPPQSLLLSTLRQIAEQFDLSGDDEAQAPRRSEGKGLLRRVGEMLFVRGD